MTDETIWKVPGEPCGQSPPRSESPRLTSWDGLPTVFEVWQGERRGHARVRAVESEYDVALLDVRLEGLLEPAPCGLPVPNAPAKVLGWPCFAEDALEGVTGRLSQARHGGCIVEVDGGILSRRSWAGLSGAPVWCGERVVGGGDPYPSESRVDPGLRSGDPQRDASPRRAAAPASPGSDPRRGQLLATRNELLRGVANRGLALVGYAGFEPRRFGRALFGVLAEQSEACLVLQSGSLGGSEPSVAARLLRAMRTRIEGLDLEAVVPTRGSDTLRVQLYLEDLVERLQADGRRLVLHLQGLSHISTDEVVELGNVLAVVCQHAGFRLVATGGRRIRELQALEFEQHSAFHEIGYPLLEGLKSHECDRLTDGLGVTEGWLWSITRGHPALSLEAAELVERGFAAAHAEDALLLHSDYLAATRVRVERASLQGTCSRLVDAGRHIAGWWLRS